MKLVVERRIGGKMVGVSLKRLWLGMPEKESGNV